MNTDKRLDSIGLGRTASASWNLGVEALYERAIRDGEGRVAAGGALLCETGQHTGRSPKDKFIVRDAASEGDVNWGAVNQPMETAAFERLLARVQAYMQNRDVYVQDLYAGADPDAPALGPRRDGAGVAQSVRPQHVHPAAARRLCRLPARLHDHPGAPASRRRPRSTAAGARR